MPGSKAGWRLGAAEAAIAALALYGLFAFARGAGTIVVLAGLCTIGLVALRAMGVQGRALLVLALGLLVVVVAIDVRPAGGHPRLGSATAHLTGGALLAWAITGPVRERLERSGSPRAGKWPAIVVLLVFAASLVWEAGEWAAQAVFGADLGYDAIDPVLDLIFGLVGALGGVFIAERFGHWHRTQV